MSSKLNLLLENRFLGHKQAVYDLQLDGFGGWYSAGSEGWIVHWQGGSESNGVLIAQAREPIYCICVLGNQSEYILAGGQSGMVYAFRRIKRGTSPAIEKNNLHELNPKDPFFPVLNSADSKEVDLNAEAVRSSDLNSWLSEHSDTDSFNEDYENLKFEKMWEHQIHEKGVFDFHEISDLRVSVSAEHPNVKIMVSCSSDGTIALWDLENPLNYLVKSDCVQGSLRCIDVNSNSDNTIRVGGHLGKIYEWEILGSTWEDFELKRKQEYTVGKNTIFQLVHHENGYFLAGRDAKIWLTDRNFNIHKQIDAHWFSIHALALSPCESYLASGSMDKCIRIWNVVDGEILFHKELAHRSSVNQLIWLDSETLVSCSDDAQIISWKIIH